MNSTALIWLKAIRPKTLPLAIASIILGSSIAAFDGYFNPLICVLALITALLLQIISNLANDYGDAISGVDDLQRVGPARVMQSGLVTKASMQKALLIAVVVATGFGLLLIYTAFGDNVSLMVGFFSLGMVAIVAAITYTMGQSPYGYKGFGDVAVFIFFGLVGVIGSYTLYTRQLYILLILPAVSCGLLSACVLNINNIRDLNGDKLAGKFTLATRLGHQKAIIYHWLMLVFAQLAMAVFIILAELPGASWLYLFALPSLFYSATRLTQYNDAELMNRQLRNTVIGSFSCCVLFALGLLISQSSS